MTFNYLMEYKNGRSGYSLLIYLKFSNKYIQYFYKYILCNKLQWIEFR